MGRVEGNGTENDGQEPYGKKLSVSHAKGLSLIIKTGGVAALLHSDSGLSGFGVHPSIKTLYANTRKQNLKPPSSKNLMSSHHKIKPKVGISPAKWDYRHCKFIQSEIGSRSQISYLAVLSTLR